MKKIILSALVAMVLAACAKEEATIAKIEEVKNPYAVTTDEAVQLLQTVIGGESTRAISVGEIKTLRKSDFVPTTRGADDGDLIYIVDLENGGSAIMGADKRMEPIYAILDETKVSPEQLTLTATRSDDGEQDIEEYLMGLVNNKIQVDVMGFEHTLPEMPIVPRPQYVTVTTQLGSKAPLLETKWGWGAPYNNMFASSLVCKCMSPIAIAQLFYYYQQPNSLNGYTFDFNLISQCEYGQTPSSLAAAEVSKLVYAIVQYGGYTGGELKFYRGEVTSIFNGAGYSATGFTSANSMATDNNFVKTELNNNKPILMSATNVLGDAIYEYWIIDGYNFYRKDVYLREYDPLGSGLYTDTLQSSTTYNLCHCNYGRFGVCDGYYSAGVFDLTSQLSNSNINTSIGDVAGTANINYSSNIAYLIYSM